jgi:hypothetical protein
MMQTVMDLRTWIQILVLTGLAAWFIADLVAVAAVNRAKQETIRMAEEAGVEISPNSARGSPVFATMGRVYCTIFIIVAIVGVLYISFRSLLSEDLATIFDISVGGIFSVLLWGEVICRPFYYRAERRRLQCALEDALSKKGV